MKNIKTCYKVLIGICIIIIIAFATMKLKKISSMFYENEMGTTVGNVQNGGYAVSDDKYFYCIGPNEGLDKSYLYKIKKGTNDKEVLFETNDNQTSIGSLNISHDKLYFTVKSYTRDDNGFVFDNKIYSMNVKGSGLKVINDNEFSANYSAIYVIKNKIYYVGTDENVYTMDLDGSNKKMFLETQNGFISISEKYILYTYDAKIFYIKSLDKDDEKILTYKSIYLPSIYDDYVYYINDKSKLIKISIINGEEETVLDNEVDGINICNGNIYYWNYKNKQNFEKKCIYEKNIETGEEKLIKETDYMFFMNVVEDNIYYMDSGEQVNVNIINTNDLNEINIMKLEI